MFFDNSFGQTLDIMHRSMDANMLRQDVIANNIANSDTPNFKRSEVNFETRLRDALEGPREPRFDAALTNEKHIPFRQPLDYRDVRPTRFLDHQTTAKNNGNNVDIEQESMNLLNNELMYTLLTNSVSTQLTRVNMVLR
ncbi:MAG: flagellar basal body rod protein FlgB [Spirochaetes bacterium]|jgi:flagellar basal-body rod protein FlgB|nr:flagellar basal body rod protein FlgB [Spirochaetota bacterium]